MKKLLLVVLALVCVGAITASAQEKEENHLAAKLFGITETNPSTILSNGSGTFTATLNNDSSITYTLSYSNMSSPVTQSHIHIGATKITGGVAIFLCTNLKNAPAGTTVPECPNDSTNSGTVTGTVSAANVIAITAQGLAAGDFTTVKRAIASGVAYANVHTMNFAPGEIRGQIHQQGDDQDDLLPGAKPTNTQR